MSYVKKTTGGVKLTPPPAGIGLRFKFKLFNPERSKGLKNLNLTRKPTIKVKNYGKKILSQMITQGGWIYKFIQFNLIKKCANFL